MISQLPGLSLSSSNAIDTINRNLLNSMAKISSGSNINKPSDNPSSYYASKKMEKNIKLYDSQAKLLEREKNLKNTLSYRMSAAENIITKMSELTESAKGATVSPEEKEAVQNEMNQLSMELDHILTSSNLGSLKELNLEQISLNETNLDFDTINQSLNSAFKLITEKNLSIANQSNGHLRQINQLNLANSNIKSSLSSIKDADLASENIKLSNLKIQQNLGIKSLQSQTDVLKSQFDLFG